MSSMRSVPKKTSEGGSCGPMCGGNLVSPAHIAEDPGVASCAEQSAKVMQARGACGSPIGPT